jgi:putative radical SAM enzyme (TIGR03279 family)
VSGALISSVKQDSPAARVGLRIGDEIITINDVPPTDVIEYQRMVDDSEIRLEVRRESESLVVQVSKGQGEPLGVTVESAVFDKIRTCDNHCSFCFIYQLPKGMRRSLYVKDDDYRLSFLYGNYTTLTRFTEFDLERVVDERLSPLYVSIHATDPSVRSEMLRNPRGATSLRWLSSLLAEGIEVHGQVVLCPGINDQSVLVQTLSDVLTKYPDLKTLSIVPVGVSDFTTEAAMRPLTPDEARKVIDIVQEFQKAARNGVGRTLIYASDEIYLLATQDPPSADRDVLSDLIENGVGLTAAFQESFRTRSEMNSLGTGFFQSVDGAPAEGYRRPRMTTNSDYQSVSSRLVLFTGEYGAVTLRQLLQDTNFEEVEVVGVVNHFFGGNIKVAGLLTGTDLNATLSAYLGTDVTVAIPDVCLSEGRFLDGLALSDLIRPVDVIPTNGLALREYLERWQADRSAR